MASPSRPVLSICIPTRNRASYLRSALRGLTDPSPFPFPIEIVVSDNASDDETPRVVQERIAGGAPIRYFRQPRDIGAHPNMFAAYRRAEAEFAVYLADDDALLPESVAATIAWLHANPHVVALYAPFQNYDPVGEVVSSVTFHLPEEIEYTAADRLRLLDMLLAHDLVPEVPIFRTRAIGATLFRSATVYWAYPLLDRLLEAGAVKFSNRPFTRVFTRHWAGEERTTLGMGNSVAQWDRYHRGLEFLYRRAVATGAPTPAQRADLERGLEQRRLYFLTAAFRSSFHAADFVAATELAQLLAVADVESLAPAVRVSVTLSFDRATRELARMFAAADLVLDTLDLLSELKGIAMFGFAAPDSVVTLIQRRRSDQRLELLTDVMDPRFRSEFLVLAADRMQREVLINLGFAPGRVIDFAQLLVAVSVLPPTPASPAG